MEVKNKKMADFPLAAVPLSSILKKKNTNKNSLFFYCAMRVNTVHKHQFKVTGSRFPSPGWNSENSYNVFM